MSLRAQRQTGVCSGPSETETWDGRASFETGSHKSSQNPNCTVNIPIHSCAAHLARIFSFTFDFVQAMKHLDLNALLLVIAFQMATGIVFLYCFTGSLSTEQFYRFGSMTYESDWYKWPNELQKYVLLIIANAQRPQIFNGFNVIDLNLLAFTKVFFLIKKNQTLLNSFQFQIMRTVASYYMMFKSLAK